MGAFFAHGIGLFNDFTNWDDNLYVTENVRTQSLSFANVVDTLNPVLTPSDPFPEYQPIRDLSLAVDWKLWNGNPLGFHLTNLLVHSANVVLLYFFILLFFSSEIIAFFVALIFAVHPIHVESVAWVSSRKDVLGLFFVLLSCITFWKGEEKKSSKFWFFSILALLFALLSKSQAVTVPLLLLVFCLWKKRESALRLTPHFLLVAAYVFHFLSMQFERTSVASYYDLGFEPNVAAILQTLARYVWKIFVPIQLSPYYDLNYELKQFNGWFVLSLLTTGLFFFLIYYFWNRKRAISICLLLFVIQLLPVLNFLPHPIWIADRYLYFGAFFVVCGIGLLFENRSFKFSKVWISGVALVLCFLSFQYTQTWENSKTLWEHVLRQYPHAYPAQLNLANVYREEGNTNQAEALMTIALKERPKDVGLLMNMGSIKHHTGDFESALKFYNQGLQREPKNAKLVFNRARALHALHRYDDAKQAYQMCIEMSASNSGCYSGLGNILAKQGKFESAGDALSKSVELDPKNADAFFDLGVLEVQRKNKEKAKNFFQKVLLLKPDYPNAKEALALIGQ